MADKLRDDPFWRERIINFVADALGGYRNLTPVSNFEKKILERSDDIKIINESVDGGLVQLLRNSKDYIPPATALRVLMYWHDQGRIQIGYEIVFFAGRDQIVLTEEEVTRLISDLRKDPDLNVSWVMTILDGTEEHSEEKAPQRNVLNLPSDFR